MCWKCNVIGAIVDKIKSKQIGRMPTKKNFPSIFANFFLFFSYSRFAFTRSTEINSQKTLEMAWFIWLRRQTHLLLIALRNICLSFALNSIYNPWLS